MEPSNSTFYDTLAPTAVYSTRTSEKKLSYPHEAGKLGPARQLRNDRLTWQFDGVDVDGMRFFIRPCFTVDKPPLRIDVFLPKTTAEISARLGANMAVLAAGKPVEMLEELDIVQHLLAALTKWSSAMDDFEERYTSMPFGSQIILKRLALSIEDQAQVIDLVPVYELERQWHSFRSLCTLWQQRRDARLFAADGWPPVIALKDLKLCRQLHEAISLVKIGEEQLVFKSLTRDIKYMYHELRLLLSLQPHPGVIGRPRYIVTKKCRFGGKHGICGFVLPYYPLGNLRNALETGSFGLDDRYRWARQITEAIAHLQGSPAFYYPDVKPDNVVLIRVAEGLNDARIIDLEQRGGWFSWSPPEVAYVEYLEIIATNEDPDHDEVQHFARLLREYYLECESGSQSISLDNNDEALQGFSSAWRTLREPRSFEAAQVFMIGKLFWCIFENKGSINSGLSPDILREEEPEHEFPDFRATPDVLRPLIKACTAGASEWNGRKRPIRRLGNILRLSIDSRATDEEEKNDKDTSDEIHQAAAGWWRTELDSARQYIEHKLEVKRNGQSCSECQYNLCASIRQRPRLEEILVALRT